MNLKAHIKTIGILLGIAGALALYLFLVVITHGIFLFVVLGGAFLAAAYKSIYDAVR